MNIIMVEHSTELLIGASEASPFLVFNVAILSVCMYVCILSVCMYVCMYHHVIDRHDNLLLGLRILTNFYVNAAHGHN